MAAAAAATDLLAYVVAGREIFIDPHSHIGLGPFSLRAVYPP